MNFIKINSDYGQLYINQDRICNCGVSPDSEHPDNRLMDTAFINWAGGKTGYWRRRDNPQLLDYIEKYIDGMSKKLCYPET